MENTMEIPSKQEMFDRAWKGLASQGWRQAVSGSVCQYLIPAHRNFRTGEEIPELRCAWGWVDPIGTTVAGYEGVVEGRSGGVYTLACCPGGGLARELYMRSRCGPDASEADGLLQFAERLQAAHDRVGDNGWAKTLRESMEAFASREGLTIPTSEG